MEMTEPQLEDLIYEGNPLKFRNKKRKIIFLIALVTLAALIIIIVVIVSKSNNKENENSNNEENDNFYDNSPDLYKEFKQNTFFFFDPISDKPCTENNYWTPIDNTTTCYRFVSATINDTAENNKIKIMLDHNIATSNFSDYKKVLNQITSSWSRYRGSIDIMDESSIYELIKYKKKPEINTPASPGPATTHYHLNSYYILDKIVYDQKGYWTKTEYNADYSYSVDVNGKNVIKSKSAILGIRPVLYIKKSVLNINSEIITISDIIRNGTKKIYQHETKEYDGFIYQSLQGFTVTKDKLVFMSANNNNRQKSVMYSYKLNDINNLYKSIYNNTGHGNGVTYNSKTNQVLVIGDNPIFVFKGETLELERLIPRSSFPACTGIAYNDISDIYIGYKEKRVFLTDGKNGKLYQIDVPVFETCQDIEFHNGYAFLCSCDFGANNQYQSYSFFNAWGGMINIYDMNLDKNKKPTKNFGRLVARLYISGFGELEDVSFRDGYIYFGFAPTGRYAFYKVDYKKLVEKVKKIS